MGFNLFGEFEEKVMDGGKYTRKVNTPIYTPTMSKPNICLLVDAHKTNRLIKKILQSNVSEDEKKFLIEAAHRHAIFNFELIAEYYAHSSKEMQELMEESALVVIDFDKSIELGYTKLEGKLRELFKEEIKELKKKKNEK